MIDTAKARSIAAGWISPGVYSRHITAFATGHPNWTRAGLLDDIQREISDVIRNPHHYEHPVQCARELKQLLEYARFADR